MTVAILFFQSAEAEIEQCPVFGRLGKRPLFFLILSCRFGRIHREDGLHCVRFFESLGNNRGHGTNLGFGNSLCALFFILFCPLGKKFLRKIFIKQEMPFYSSGGFFLCVGLLFASLVLCLPDLLTFGCLFYTYLPSFSGQSLSSLFC